ncbi:hypothetical protein OH76DRAFT_160793 [Lentinus brumalis]|uniref:GIY-YIG domain-containing protein n=1 Tax=Lentinus brumalis TaxID=2498619 RepID=A0A371DIW1_9APHY|nr:hypothetical protein OH76DRAFT_160793 [Polyporus brumalis]
MPRTTKSSLAHHHFPAFYACYLLKSVRTPRATATYIGSTPSPPRRIRQHNGQISQGAWKTKWSRPWVMQMIVHGFPSKLAALQFEWAWQHPNVSRHLRDNGGQAVFNQTGKLKYMNTNVRVARSMVSSHPYNTWPLSVTLFTEEAEKAWNHAAKAVGMPPLPSGLKVLTELEGVDGKSGKSGSGRTEPIDVTDDTFTSEHLHKASTVFSAGSALKCSICQEPIQHDVDPLSVALCPSSSCTAVSHLSCLSRRFLDAQPASSSADIIPRGGTCKSCGTYVLWGDVIRGCYRRREGGVVPDAELEDADDRDDLGQLFGADFEDEDEDAAPGPSKPSAPPRTKKRVKPRAGPSKSKGAPYSTLAAHASSDEREHFDLDAISSGSDEQESDIDERPQWHSPTKTKPSSRPSSSKTISARAPEGNTSAAGAASGCRFRDLRDRGGSGPQGASLIEASNPAGTHAVRPRNTTAAPAGPVRNKFRAESSHKAPQASRKPHSADVGSVGMRDVDPPGSAGDSGRASCPPSNRRKPAVDNGGWQASATPLEIAREKTRLRPFPDLPPLSPPHLPMGDRAQEMRAFHNEVVEISD